MIISEKQIHLLIDYVRSLYSILDAANSNPSKSIKFDSDHYALNTSIELIADLLVKIKDQQSDELKSIE